MSVCLVVTAAFFSLGTQPLLWAMAMPRMSGVVAAVALAFISMLGTTGDFVGPYAYMFLEGLASSNRPAGA